MLEHVGIEAREMRNMCGVGIGEGVERQAAARASWLAMSGISPVKIAFQPSRNCASVMPMPSEARSAAKYSASLSLPVSCWR
jgi:hypothetical protein